MTLDRLGLDKRVDHFKSTLKQIHFIVQDNIAKLNRTLCLISGSTIIPSLYVLGTKLSQVILVSSHIDISLTLLTVWFGLYGECIQPADSSSFHFLGSRQYLWSGVVTGEDDVFPIYFSRSVFFNGIFTIFSAVDSKCSSSSLCRALDTHNVRFSFNSAKHTALPSLASAWTSGT